MQKKLFNKYCVTKNSTDDRMWWPSSLRHCIISLKLYMACLRSQVQIKYISMLNCTMSKSLVIFSYGEFGDIYECRI